MNAHRDAKREYLIEQIGVWAANRKAGVAVEFASRQDIGGLVGAERAFALRSSLMLNMAQYYAFNPAADCGPGVLTATTLLSDNEAGYSTVSIATLAKLLNRHPRRVMEARQRCVEAGVLNIEERPGQSSICWPTVPQELITNPSVPLAWQLRALTGAPARPGRPRQEKPLHDPVTRYL